MVRYEVLVYSGGWVVAMGAADTIKCEGMVNPDMVIGFTAEGAFSSDFFI